jgi:hypothetical protein
MRRGFKAEAERLAVRIRAELKVAADRRVDVDELALHVGVEVASADSLVSIEDLERLDRLQPGCFSAATLHLPNGRVVAVTNPVGCSPARRDSDLAHELAHIILKHDARSVDRIGDLTFFECDPEQEDEANWLGGCLLLPRPLLLIEARRGLGVEQIADRHEVSLEMARFRYNASGVQFQVKGRPAAR